METINKIVRIGKLPDGNAFAKISFVEGKLSISGAIGPKTNGDARGIAGQWIMSLKEYDARGHLTLSDFELAPGWTSGAAKRFFDVWDEWHMNDMRAGCVHQRRDRWADRPIDPSKPTTAYGKHHPNQQQDSWNMLVWVRPDEVPGGLLCAPCPECGYKYGSAWMKQDVPSDVLDFLRSLPETDIKPAWC